MPVKGLTAGHEAHHATFQRKETLRKFTGEEDEKHAPRQTKEGQLPWWYFNSDFGSSDRKFKEIEETCKKYEDKKIDVRPYMIKNPYVV